MKDLLSAQTRRRKAFTELAASMLGFGLLVGLLFPPLIIPLGIAPEAVLRPSFFASTVTAGLVVGLVAFSLARHVVRGRLRRLTRSMNRVAGIIEESADDGGSWSERDPDTCALEVDSADEFGEVATAFNLLLYTVFRARVREEALSSYSAVLASRLELGEVGSLALHGALEHGGAGAGAVFLVEDAGHYRAVGSYRMEADAFLDALRPYQLLPVTQLAVHDVAGDISFDAVLLPFRPSAVVAIPLCVDRRSIGMALLAYPSEPTVEQLRMLELLRDPAAVALDNALTHERLQHLAAVDPLTGCFNRRVGLARLREEFARAVRTGAALGLLAFDIDHFKRVNDTHGHLRGDEVLRAVTQTIRASLREQDVLIRSGGEEFLALLPGATRRATIAVGERVRRAVQDTPCSTDVGSLRVTTSVGALSYPDTPGQGPDDLLSVVDGALYDAKRSGRNHLTYSSGADASGSGTSTTGTASVH